MSTWKIDPAHTDVSFSAKHLMITTVRGKFDRVEGEVVLEEADPLASRGEIRVGAASLSTGSEQRDTHLRSADFFDVERYPWIVAQATAIEQQGDTYRIHAAVTIRDETHPVTFETEFLGIVPGLGGKRHAGFHLSGTVNREDWGVSWNMALEAGGLLVSKEINLDIDVAVDEVGEPAPAG